MQPQLTQQQALDLVNNAANKSALIVSDLTGYSDPDGAQCEAFISWYVTNLGYASVGHYNAIDFWQKNPLGLARVSIPQPGDIFYMQPQPLGHVGVVARVSIQGSTVISVDENWYNSSLTHGSPAAYVTHPINQIIGFLRPQFKEQGMNRPYNNDDAINVANDLGASYDELKGKQDWNDVYYAAIKPRLIQFRAQIASLTTQVEQLQATTPNPDVAALGQLIKKIANE